MGGVMVFSVPLGYNPYLDALIKDKKIKLTHTFFLKRLSLSDWRNFWKSCSHKEAFSNLNYNPSRIQVICIGVIQK